MKKLLLEYVNIIAYTITGLIFGFSFFLLFINFYHYRDIDTTYIKQENDKNMSIELLRKLKQVEVNLGSESQNNLELSSIKLRLGTCIKIINSKEFLQILSEEKIDIQDVYKMQQFYQKQISNECLVKQLYELSVDNNLQIQDKELKTISPFLKSNINQLIKATDYVQKNLKNNSSYSISSQSSKNDLYEQTRDSYYEIFNDYVSATDFIYDLSVWYKNKVGGA